MRVLITGSSDGVGSLVAKNLTSRGHSVILHARSEQRAQDAKAACPAAEACLVADLTDIAHVKSMAQDINALGQVDAIIHNAGLYEPPYSQTKEGWTPVFAVNVVAPYILSCSTRLPKRLLFISSNAHNHGDGSLKDITWMQRGKREYDSPQAYSDSKLQVSLIASAFARRFPEMRVNSVDPGWVPTKMGGPDAPDDIGASVDTYTLLAEGAGDAQDVTGKYWLANKIKEHNPVLDQVVTQEALLKELKRLTGVCVRPSTRESSL